MKPSYPTFAVFIILFSFSILFVSCSQESGITSPNESNITPMAKTDVVPKIKLNHDVDTVITLPNSKITITISKSVPAKKIALIDDYLLNEKKSSNYKKFAPPTTQGIKPDLRYCQYEFDTVTFWESQQLYQSVPNHLMGIWTNVISYDKAYKQYGFNELFIQPSELSSVLASKTFHADSLIMGLATGPNQVNNNLNSITSNSTVGYYFVDEPNGHNVPTGDIQSLELAVYNKSTNSKFMMSNEHWPESSLCNGYIFYDGPAYNNYLQSNNSGIMCDMYDNGNACGTIDQYWNEFWNYYHPIHSWMNWANNVASGANAWPYCFSWMNYHGINNVWLYAYVCGNEGVIQQWCANEWAYGWLLQYQEQKVNVLINTSTTCDPGGPYQLYQTWYTGQVRWAVY